MLHGLISTSRGWVGITWSERGLRRLNLPVRDRKEALALLGLRDAGDAKEDDGTCAIRRSLIDYFDGKQTSFDCKLDLSGSTPFQQRVWDTTREIPYGQVRSYKWVAEKMGRPSACRAVGHALAVNPLPVIVPCHRVICSDGRPGGFGGRAGDVQTKLSMLSLEGCRLST